MLAYFHTLIEPSLKESLDNKWHSDNLTFPYLELFCHKLIYHRITTTNWLNYFRTWTKHDIKSNVHFPRYKQYRRKQPDYRVAMLVTKPRKSRTRRKKYWMPGGTCTEWWSQGEPHSQMLVICTDSSTWCEIFSCGWMISLDRWIRKKNQGILL